MRTVKLSALVVSYVLFAIVLSGCEEMGLTKWFKKEGPTDKEVARAYHLTELRRSTAADVLPMIYMPDHSLLSQSAKVLAAQGEMQKGNKIWLSLISFDENDLLAKRKYLMFVYDDPGQWFPVPSSGLRFDCQIVLEGEILEEPYADENTRQIAMMKFARQMVYDDIIEVKEDNKAFEISGAIINQSLEAVLRDLDESPALAAKLSDDAGLDFQHHSFDRGKIQMTSDEKTMTIKMRLGSFTKKFEKPEDVNYPPELEEEQ